MSMISVCFKRITIVFLIFSFLVVSFFGNTIKTVRAAGCPPAHAARMQVLHDQTTPLTEAQNTEYLSYNAEGCTTTTTAPSTNPPQTPGELGNSTGSTQSSLYIQYLAAVDAGDATKVRAILDQMYTQAGAATPEEKSKVITDAKAAYVAAKTTPPSVTESCSKKCPHQTWLWKVDDNIQSALCNTQCVIIEWEASVIGWVIEKVLYPALGLCDDSKGDCPKLPTATTP